MKNEHLLFFRESKNPDVDVDSISEEGWTSLHEIITHECQFTEVARVLLRFGANVNTQDLHRDSPLHSALLYHNLDNISLLLANNANQGCKIQIETDIHFPADAQPKVQ